MRLAIIGSDRVVDNEKELYTGYIRRLELELERAHEENRRLLDVILADKTASRGPSVEGFPEPIRRTPMSTREAARRVREFERSLRREPSEPPTEVEGAREIEKDIEEGASRAGRINSEGAGYAT